MVLEAFENFIRMSLSYLINNMVLDVSQACETRGVCLCRCVCPCVCCDHPPHAPRPWPPALSSALAPRAHYLCP